MVLGCVIILIQNSFPLTEWHVEHMEKVVTKFVTGLSENATMWEKKQNKRYGKISIVRLDQIKKHFAPSLEKSFTWWR